MENIEMRVDDNKLLIEVDLSKRLGPSKTGKTILVGTTRGATKIKGTEAKANITIYVPN